MTEAEWFTDGDGLIERPARTNGGGRARFSPTPFNKVLLDTSPAYLVKGLIPRGGLAVVWGPPKCGKSFWAFDLAMHVARGVPYRSRRVQQGAVAYLALEGGHGFRARIEAYRRAHDVADAPFYLITDRTDLVEDREALISAIRPTGPDMVVIDTLNRSLAGSENKDEDMSAYVRAADAIRAALDCAVVVIHHCGVEGTRPRGHTALTGAVDAQIAVQRDDAGNVVATVEWMKDGEADTVIVSSLERITLATDDEGDEISSCVIRPAECNAAPRVMPGKRKREGKGLHTFRDAFNEALSDTGQTISVRNDGPPVRATRMSHVRKQFELRYATGESDAKLRAHAQRMALKRIVAALPDEYATWVQGDAEWIWRPKEN